MSESETKNGNGEPRMAAPRPRPVPRAPGHPDRDLTLTEREALAHYGTMAARYDDFVVRELPAMKRDIDTTKGAALAAAGHAELALATGQRNETLAREAIAAARRSEDASKRTEAVVSNLARVLLAKARKVAEESGTQAAEAALMRSQAVTQDDLEDEARRAAELVLQGHKLEETKEERDELKEQAKKRSDRFWQFVIGVALLATGGIGGAVFAHFLAK